MKGNDEILISAGALKEKEPKLAIITAGTGLEYAQLPPFKINHVHRLYFFPNEGKETETGVNEAGNIIVLKKKMYIDGNWREEYEYEYAYVD